MTILPDVFMPFHTYGQLWGDYRISAPAAGSSPRDGDGMSAYRNCLDGERSARQLFGVKQPRVS
jgi:hypothetical protein